MKIVRSQAKGATTVELVSILIIMVPIALLAVNICFLAFGGFYNDSACRDAARAAAEQTTADVSRSAATNALENFKILGGLLGSPTIKTFKYNFSYDKTDPLNPVPFEIKNLKSAPGPKLADGEGTGTGGNAPNVYVETTMSCVVPAPILIGPTGMTDKVVLRSSYTFPVFYGLDDPLDNSGDSGNDNAGEAPGMPADE